MPKGKPWTREEEQQLKELVIRGLKAEDIAAKMGKSKDAVLKKIQRLGLKVVHPLNIGPTTSTELIIPKELPSIEEALKLLAAAINALQTPNLSKAEIARLRSIIQAVKTYKELLADYINYRQIEARLIEMEQKYAELAAKAQQACATTVENPTLGLNIRQHHKNVLRATHATKAIKGIGIQLRNISFPKRRIPIKNSETQTCNMFKMGYKKPAFINFIRREVIINS
jgi:hypothetical protein